ncbi:conserved exported hypothetical protein [Tenacibaculum litopenaei]|jgi:hypothetical protein|uniref:hypothetical protein n=1 Tax=Tenacibaculum litopenaei TaxID=396016 RepID=UPI003892DF18
MRTGILFFLAAMLFAPLQANTNTKSTSKIGVVNRYDDVLSFVERGIKFHVFLNGDFDFNTHHRTTRYVDYNGRRTRVSNGVRIERDRNGRVRRVGTVYINYDFRGNVKRIGSVFMQYRRGQLTRIGNMRIRYDRWGHPSFRGYIKRGGYYQDIDHCDDDVNIDIDISIGDEYDYDDVYFYRRDFRRNYRQFKEDDNFFYYRAVPNANIGQKARVLKRRKSKRNSDRDDLYYRANPETKRSRRN